MPSAAVRAKVSLMKRAIGKFVLAAVACGFIAPVRAEGPAPPALDAWNRYVSQVEARLAWQHGRAADFLAGPDAASGDKLRRGEAVIERVTPAEGEPVPGGLLHDWRGAAFVPGARAEDFEALLRDFQDYPRRFAPEVVAARMVGGGGDELQVALRVRQKHVISVVLDTTYAVSFGELDGGRRWSVSRSLSVREIGADGRPVSPDEEHGFLWRLNSYWTYEERDGGLYVQLESVSLTRGIPAGLGWVVGPYVESIPRESLEFTLRAACAALRAGEEDIPKRRER